MKEVGLRRKCFVRHKYEKLWLFSTLVWTACDAWSRISCFPCFLPLFPGVDQLRCMSTIYDKLTGGCETKRILVFLLLLSILRKEAAFCISNAWYKYDERMEYTWKRCMCRHLLVPCVYCWATRAKAYEVPERCEGRMCVYHWYLYFSQSGHDFDWTFGSQTHCLQRDIQRSYIIIHDVGALFARAKCASKNVTSTI